MYFLECWYERYERYGQDMNIKINIKIKDTDKYIEIYKNTNTNTRRYTFDGQTIRWKILNYLIHLCYDIKLLFVWSLQTNWSELRI